MIPLILDSSATLSWLLPDEVTPASESLLEQVAKTGADVPNIWPLEIANSLLMAERRRRLDSATKQDLLIKLKALPIQIDIFTADYAFSKIASLAEEFQLTAYDAAYLELALRLNGYLATRDKDLIKAARLKKVKVYEM